MAIVSASLSADHAEAAMETAKMALRAWAGATIPDGIDTELHVARGKIYDRILKVANDLRVDGIYVGAHSPDLRDYLLGSNAARVARHATQSVFVIR